MMVDLGTGSKIPAALLRFTLRRRRDAARGAVLRRRAATGRGMCLMALLLIGVGGSGCGGHAGRLRGSDEQFYYAQLQLERGKTLDAIEAFDQLRAAYPGSRFLDAAIFGTGRAYFGRGEYLVAATHFERVTNDFPNSDYRDDARFWLSRCYDKVSLPARLDQKYTLLAIDHYSQYVVEFPHGSRVEEARARLGAMRARLAEKETLIGEFYNHRHRYKASLLYLDRVFERYADTPLADRARVARARALAGLERNDEAQALLQEVLATAADEEQRAKAEEQLRKLTERLAEERAAGDAEEDAAEEQEEDGGSAGDAGELG
jgi:outer membrane protein assembly factor BamD